MTKLKKYKREAICEYCEAKYNETLMTTSCDELIYINDSSLVAMTASCLDKTTREINYCPMCGRKLGETK